MAASFSRKKLAGRSAWPSTRLRACVVAGAVGGAAGDQPEDGDGKPQPGGEQERAAGRTSGRCVPVRARRRSGPGTALKHAAQRAAGHAAEHDREPGGAEVELRTGGAEIGVVADEREGGDAGDDDGGQHGAAGAGLEGVAEFLDGEDDAGERRVEGGRDAGGAAGEHEGALGLRRAAGACRCRAPRMREAPTCTVGPSRPMEAPESRPSSVSKTLPAAMRSERTRATMAGSWMCIEAMTWGMPLPWAPGNTRMGQQDGEDEAGRGR